MKLLQLGDKGGYENFRVRVPVVEEMLAFAIYAKFEAFKKNRVLNGVKYFFQIETTKGRRFTILRML